MEGFSLDNWREIHPGLGMFLGSLTPDVSIFAEMQVAAPPPPPVWPEVVAEPQGVHPEAVTVTFATDEDFRMVFGPRFTDVWDRETEVTTEAVAPEPTEVQASASTSTVVLEKRRSRPETSRFRPRSGKGVKDLYGRGKRKGRRPSSKLLCRSLKNVEVEALLDLAFRVKEELERRKLEYVF
jgi:hypothetical protein